MIFNQKLDQVQKIDFVFLEFAYHCYVNYYDNWEPLKD